MKRIENTKVNRLSQCEKEIEIINKEVLDRENFTKNKYFDQAQVKVKESKSNGS